MSDQPDYNSDDHAAVADQLRASGNRDLAPPDEGQVARDLAAKQAAGPSGVTDVDVQALLAGIQELQARVESLEAEKASGAGLPVVATAQALRDLIATHAAHSPGPDHGDLLRLADDAVDAAGNAADTGDGSALHQIAAKIERALKKIHPGPGDHHYYRQAVDFASVHLPDAADQLVPAPAKRQQLTSDRAPANVVAGSVTG